MDPIGGLAKIREALAAGGRDPKGFQVTSYVPVVTRDDGTVDASATMAAVGPMVEGGITDLRATLDLPREFSACRDFLAPLVEAFRKEAGR